MPKRKNIIRLLDQVKIINPEIVVRWGYPLTKQIVKDTIITQEQKDAINIMMTKFGYFHPSLNFDQLIDETNINADDIYEKVLDTMAYHLVSKHGFGGKDRQMFTEKKESLRNKTGEVVGRKVVKTGTYHSGCGVSYDYFGESDYEPAYLEYEESHVLYRIFVHNTGYDESICPNINNEGGIWIENKNLEKENV